MHPDANHNASALDTEAKQLEETVRQLVLMKETGPKSAAWHRARVQMIWRLHRKLASRTAQPDASAPSKADAAPSKAADY